jgi:isopentenyl diphosphate isomerase/L-lactate dehydrogenase-like FMN-dependent dehydrogenase
MRASCSRPSAFAMLRPTSCCWPTWAPSSSTTATPFDQCRRAVEMIDADALILHLNPLQEAVQPEGDVNWKGLLHKIEEVCRTLGKPVVAKEVGWGISPRPPGA